jgi:hypothetical protein
MYTVSYHVYVLHQLEVFRVVLQQRLHFTLVTCVVPEQVNSAKCAHNVLVDELLHRDWIADIARARFDAHGSNCGRSSRFEFSACHVSYSSV